jgi:hypothetical protein
VGEGQATLTSAIASVRLQGSPGLLGLYLTGGLGMFRWDVPELEPNTDFALDAGIGIDYTLRSRFWLFLQYDQWWIYHEKVGEVVKNTVNRNTIRFGTRLGLF